MAARSVSGRSPRGTPTATIATTQGINSLSLSDDGSTILFTTADGLVHEHKLDGTLVPVSSLPSATAALFVDPARTLAVGGKAKLLALVPVALAWTQKSEGAVIGLESVPSGLVAGSSDGKVAVRSAADGAAGLIIASPTPTSLAVSTDGTKVAVGSMDQHPRLYQLTDGKLLQDYPPISAPITSIAFRRDGHALVTTAADGSVSTWSLPTDKPGTVQATFPTPAPATSSAWLADERQWVVGSADKVIRTFAPPPPLEIDLAGHDGDIFGVAFSSDGTKGASVSNDQSVIVWNLLDRVKLAQIQGTRRTGLFRLVPSRGSVARVLWSRQVRDPLESRGSKGSAPLPRFGGCAYQVSFMPDGKQLVAAGVDRKIHLWDVGTASEVKTLEGHPDEIYGLALRPDGKRLVTSGYGGNVIVWNVDSGQQVFTHKLAEPAYSVAYRRDGAQLAVGSADQKVYLIDLPDTAK